MVYHKTDVFWKHGKLELRIDVDQFYLRDVEIKKVTVVNVGIADWVWSVLRALLRELESFLLFNPVSEVSHTCVHVNLYLHGWTVVSFNEQTL